MHMLVSVACVGLVLAAGAREESYTLKFKEWPEGAGQAVAVRETTTKVAPRLAEYSRRRNTLAKYWLEESPQPPRGSG